MSSFSRFLKELPFLPKQFRRQESQQETRPSLAPDLTGITINVYELELQDEDGNCVLVKDNESEETSNVDSSPVEDEKDDARMPWATTSGLATISSHQLRYANVVVFCNKCKSEVPVCTLDFHRKRHQALEALRYTAECPPVTVRGLLRRRNKAMSDVIERSYVEEGQLIRSIQKINSAFDLLKSELEGMGAADYVPRTIRWREKDLKAEGKDLNYRIPLGVSTYRKPDSGSLATRCVYVENFLEIGKGVFLGIYQGYNGSYVTQLCVRELHKDIQRNLHELSDGNLNVGDVKSAFLGAYKRIDKVQLIAEGERPWGRWSGCSAVTCLLVDDVLYVANEGRLKGLLIRENNTIRTVTSCHDLYNRKERMRVRRNRGLIVKTEKCALVNGILATTRGIGNQGDWSLKVCVINKPTFKVVSLRDKDRMLVLASEGLWKVLNHREVLFLINKFIRDAVTKTSRLDIEEEPMKNKTLEGNFLVLPKAVKHDPEFKSFAKNTHMSPIDFRVPENVNWNPNNPQIVIRRATLVTEEPRLEDSPSRSSQKSHFNDAERDDQDSQELARIVNEECESTYARQEIARLLSKRLLKSALIAGAEMDSVVMVLLLQGFKIERKEM